MSLSHRSPPLSRQYAHLHANTMKPTGDSIVTLSSCDSSADIEYDVHKIHTCPLSIGLVLMLQIVVFVA